MSVFPAAARYVRLYIALSLHVASAVAALAIFTRLSFGYDIAPAPAAFIFLSSIVAYNLAKYGEAGAGYVSTLRQRWHDQYFRLMFFISALSAGASLLLARHLSAVQLAIAALAGTLTLLYIWPAFNGYSLRSLPGLKIFIIALSWTLTCVCLPLAGAEPLLSAPVLWHSATIFFYILAVMIPFEIRDTLVDSPGLRTLPQTLGFRLARHLGAIWAFLALGFTFANPAAVPAAKWSTGGLMLFAVLLIYASKPSQSFWYASFWVEGLPLLWLVAYAGFSLI